MPKKIKRLLKNPGSKAKDPTFEEAINEPVLPSPTFIANQPLHSAQRSVEALARIPSLQARQQVFNELQRSYGNQFAISVARSFQTSPDTNLFDQPGADDPRFYTFENGQSLFLKSNLRQTGRAEQTNPTSGSISSAPSHVQRTIKVRIQAGRLSNTAKAINELITKFNSKNESLRAMIKEGEYKDLGGLADQVQEQLSILNKLEELAGGKKWKSLRKIDIDQLFREISDERTYLEKLAPQAALELAQLEGGDAEEIDSYAEYKERSSGLEKRAKHFVSSGIGAVYGLAGKQHKALSSHPEMKSLTASDAPDVEVKGQHGGVRKGAGGVAKLLLGNFIEAAASGKKASQLSNIKKDLSSEENSILEEDFVDLMQMINSLKGAFKRQAFWESTVGTLKQALSLGVSAVTGAPGVGHLVASSASQIGTFAGSSALSAVSGVAAEKAAPSERFIGGGATKLDEEGWSRVLTKFLNHEDERLQSYTEDIISSIFLEGMKGEELLIIARASPGEAAKLILARQQGAVQFKDALKRYRKAHK